MLSKDSLLDFLDALPYQAPVYIAYSGGLDSHVLLHAMASLRERRILKVHALHVNHNLHKDSDRWAEHCIAIARELGVECEVLTIRDRPSAGCSLEAWARTHRYRLLESAIPGGAILLTAHHQSDQAETLLLQILRGCGPAGLAAMPGVTLRDKLIHARPFLGVSRRELRNYALEHKLRWIEDESNKDISHDRNFLRHEVFPVLERRWPATAKVLGRAAAHQAEALVLLEEIAARDADELVEVHTQTISADRLASLSDARQSNLIRWWVRSLGLPVPGSRHLAVIKKELLAAADSRIPLVRWPGCELRRYRGKIYAASPLSSHDSSMRSCWSLTDNYNPGGGTLSATRTSGSGLKAEICKEQQLEVRYRQGGEKIRLPGKTHSQELKKLFQEAGVPPWIRSRIPLLYGEDRLVAVADIWRDASACAKEGEPSWEIKWHPAAEYAQLLGSLRGC